MSFFMSFTALTVTFLPCSTDVSGGFTRGFDGAGEGIRTLDGPVGNNGPDKVSPVFSNLQATGTRSEQVSTGPKRESVTADVPAGVSHLLHRILVHMEQVEGALRSAGPIPPGVRNGYAELLAESREQLAAVLLSEGGPEITC